MDFDVRFIVLDNEVERGVLYPEKWTWTSPMNDTPALSLSVSKQDARAAALARNCIKFGFDIAVQVNFGKGYYEPFSGRFIITDDSEDLAELNGAINLTGLGVDWDLNGLINVDQTFYDPTTEMVRYAAYNTGPAKCMEQMLTQGSIYSLCQLITMNPVTANGRDTTGASFDTDFLRFWTIPAANTARQTLDSWVEMGALDWRFQGNRLHMYRRDTVMNRNFTVYPVANPGGVELRIGREFATLISNRSRREYAGRIVTFSETNKMYSHDLATTNVPRRGKRAIVSQASGVAVVADALVVAQSIALRTGASYLSEFTQDLSIESSEFLPIRDYLPGDNLTASGDEGLLMGFRVQQITLTGGVNVALGGSVILGDRLGSQTVNNRRRVAIRDGGNSRLSQRL